MATYNAPTQLAKLWVRYVVGFTVGVGIGLAPYLGAIDVPLFTPLLSMLPRAVRSAAIPISAAAMGLVALGVQWWGTEMLSASVLRRAFIRAAAGAVLTLSMFLIVHNAIVVAVPLDGGRTSESFVVSLSRSTSCRCSPEDSDAACIRSVSFDAAEIDRCWGDRNVRLAQLMVSLSYVFATTSLGVLVGLVVLKADKPSTQSRKRKRVVAGSAASTSGKTL